MIAQKTVLWFPVLFNICLNHFLTNLYMVLLGWHISSLLAQQQQQQLQLLAGLLCNSNIIPLYPLGFFKSESIDAFPELSVLSHSQRFALCWVHNSLIPVTFSPGPCSVSSQNTVHAALELKREADDMLLFHPPNARRDASKLGLSKE